MTPFTRAQLEHQRDLAVDMVVSLIEEKSLEAKAVRQTPAERQATTQRLAAKLSIVDDVDPDATVVFEMVIDRLLARGVTYTPFH